MSDDELTAMQEELAEARAELERLQVTAADREARAAHLESQQAQLQEELAQARSEAEARDQELTGLREQGEALQERVRSSAQRYRELALEHSPELPQELVTGETVEDVDQALQRARETVSKVRGHLESQAQAGRVPVGAPPRSAPDLSALSTEEKIRFGLQQGSGR
jgi:chromosome segregation ATPase